MAEALDSQDCPLCLEKLSEPVALGCEHRFCSGCLRRHWAPSLSGACPSCSRRSSRELPPLFALEKKPPEDASTKDKDQPQSVPTPGESSVSERRSERELKEKIQTEIRYVREKEEKIKGKEKLCLEMLEHSEQQTQHCESQIRATFRQLHELLQQEEQRRLRELTAEQKKNTWIKKQELRDLQTELSDLSVRVQAAEQQLQGGSLDSLTDSLKNLVLERRSKVELRLETQPLINQAEVLGNLGSRIWERMGEQIEFSPVILDPNTAHRSLCLSDDLTSVRLGASQQELPLDPQRFTQDLSVLGSEGFSFGVHQWDVEVGDHPCWAIGVARESSDRRKRLNELLLAGVWCLRKENSKYLDVLGRELRLRSPDKIRVMVDCDEGQIFFSDAAYMTKICSQYFYPISSEKVFPYFSVGAAGANTRSIKICPVKAHVNLKESPQRPEPVPRQTGSSSYFTPDFYWGSSFRRECVTPRIVESSIRQHVVRGKGVDDPDPFSLSAAGSKSSIRSPSPIPQKKSCSSEPAPSETSEENLWQ